MPNNCFQRVAADAVPPSTPTSETFNVVDTSLIITEDIHDWLDVLVKTCPGTREVWLIGSRASGCARGSSDWDFLWFASPLARSCLKSASNLHRNDVDCFAIDDAGDFMTAWGSEKKGSLSSWEWQRLSETVASYLSIKWVPHEDDNLPGSNTGEIVKVYRKAYRVWP